MSASKSVASLFVCLVVACLSKSAHSQDTSVEDSRSLELTQERFEQLHREVRPNDQDPWRTIPWQTKVLEGQQLAAESQKPIFIWAMDGHPLGCT